MKLIIALFTLLFAGSNLCNALEGPRETWTVVKNAPLFTTSAEFNFKTGNEITGKVVRTGLLCPRYYYDFFDAQGQFQMRGVTRAFSLGFLFAWGMEIDLYDAAEVYAGSIRGEMMTKSRAKFTFYGPAGETRSIAYLNAKKPNLLVVNPVDESQVIAELTGKTYGDVSTWTVEVKYEPSAVDDGLMKIFSAFVADYDSSFSEPPKTVIHYNFNTNNRN